MNRGMKLCWLNLSPGLTNNMGWIDVDSVKNEVNTFILIIALPDLNII